MKRLFERALPLYLATTALAAACTLLLLPCSHAAPPAGAAPGSIVALLDTLPELPASAEQAADWVDRQGRLVHPGLLAFEAAIETHRQAVARIARADAVQQHQQGTIAGENLMQGMADVGIDVQRLQTDPAYQRELQERFRRMTPAEQVVMAQRLNAPLNQDRRFVNAAQAMAEDVPAARAAAEAGFAYTQGQPARSNTQQALWQETEEQVRRVLAKKLDPGLAKPAMEYDNIGCDKACRGRWHAYADRLLPLMVARETEVLRLRRAALARQRAAVLAGLKAADEHLQAAQFGAASRSTAHIGRIVAYDGAALAELTSLLARSGDIARSAALTVHCGRQAVLVPAAVCQ